jgi:protein gp37
MLTKTGIPYLDFVWNPTTGCDPEPFSPGCENCWARELSRTRLKDLPGYGPQFPVTLWPDRLDDPVKRKKPARIGVTFMGDLFCNRVPDAYLNRVFEVMAEKAPQHTYILLTKRAGSMAGFINGWLLRSSRGILPRNIWPCVTVESNHQAWRISQLLDIPAEIIGISYEPALGPLTLPLKFLVRGNQAWLIYGGENGRNARPAYYTEFLSVWNQCRTVGVPVYFKQWGAASVIPEFDWSFPREFPKGGSLL